MYSLPLTPPNSGITYFAPLRANCSYPAQISIRSLHLQINASFSAKIVSSPSKVQSFLDECFFIYYQELIQIIFHYLQQSMLSCKSAIHYSTSPSNMSSLLIFALHLLIIWLLILDNRPFILSGVLKYLLSSQMILTLFITS